jgi:hypothetical protein
VNDIVEILCKYDILTGQWRRFYRKLGTSNPNLYQWEMRYNNGDFKIEDLFFKIMEDYVTSNLERRVNPWRKSRYLN